MITGESILELAVGAEDLDAYRRALLDCLHRSIGLDAAIIISTDLTGRVSFVQAGYGDDGFIQNVHTYMDEFSSDEMEVMAAPGWSFEADWLTPARRDELGLYRELLHPLGLRTGAGHMWRSRHGIYGAHIASAARSHRFLGTERAVLNRLSLAMKFGEACFARCAQHSPRVAGWSAGKGLSRREQDVAELALRGLRNAEIATVIGTSVNTIRNQLATIFRKTGVTTRTELAFVAAQELAVPHDGAPSRVPSWVLQIHR